MREADGGWQWMAVDGVLSNEGEHLTKFHANESWREGKRVLYCVCVCKHTHMDTYTNIKQLQMQLGATRPYSLPPPLPPPSLVLSISILLWSLNMPLTQRQIFFGTHTRAQNRETHVQKGPPDLSPAILAKGSWCSCGHRRHLA